jgi:hypothetical protein
MNTNRKFFMLLLGSIGAQNGKIALEKKMINYGCLS